MFKKRKCNQCGKKFNEKYRFCPYCGSNDKEFDNEDWGMLGRDDILSQSNFQLPPGLNILFNSLMKNLSKQLNGMQDELGNEIKRGGISISISTPGKGFQKVKTTSSENKKKQSKKIPGQFSAENSKRFSKLSKKEPQTNIRRLSDKVIYEIEIPEVKSLKDVSIVRLETSIEIKAIGKNNAYFKRIPINYPIIDYDFSEEKLVLEFGVKN